MPNKGWGRTSGVWRCPPRGIGQDAVGAVQTAGGIQGRQGCRAETLAVQVKVRTLADINERCMHRVGRTMAPVHDMRHPVPCSQSTQALLTELFSMILIGLPLFVVTFVAPAQRWSACAPAEWPLCNKARAQKYRYCGNMAPVPLKRWFECCGMW